MLSTYPEKQYAVRYIRLGAAGYLNKSADPNDMVAAVRKVAAGGMADPTPRRHHRYDLQCDSVWRGRLA